jgi:cysteinyl-tRNA synthetase
MDLKLYDTLTREKRVFTPIDPDRVRMYVCGPTVYDFAHIGNARPVIVFDVLYRLLRHLYGADHVKYVRNITDVDDKINARAAERGIPIRELTEETYRNFKEDVAALGCLPPDVEPRATEHIEEMKTLIERLVASGHAYAAEEHVLFSVPSMPDYGQLSKRPLDEMIAGARVDVAPYKRHDQDFVLWKPSKPGEPGWPSPCGISTPGRPGWHIECSAMSWKHLGEVFDIHGGGIDLVFPHHENEIAQTRCAFHTGVMANFWMHNGFLQVEGEKMSKSLGNFVTIRELLSRFVGDAIRLTMMETHYRQPIDWTRSGLDNSRRQLFQWAQLIEGHHVQDSLKQPNLGDADSEFIELLSDDLNMPSALARLRQMFNEAHLDRQMASRFASHVAFLGFRNLDKPGFFRSGFAHYVPEGRPQISADTFFDVMSYQAATANSLPIVASSYLNRVHSAGINTSIDLQGNVIVGYAADPQAEFNDRVRFLIEARSKARVEKNWAESDRIRDELAAMGVVLKDSKDGTTWEIAR